VSRKPMQEAVVGSGSLRSLCLTGDVRRPVGRAKVKCLESRRRVGDWGGGGGAGVCGRKTD